jgi:hypothetical protein
MDSHRFERRPLPACDNARTAPLSASLCAALDRLRAGVKCAECGWQEATVVSGPSRRCLCTSCRTVERALNFAHLHAPERYW